MDPKRNISPMESSPEMFISQTSVLAFAATNQLTMPISTVPQSSHCDIPETYEVNLQSIPGVSTCLPALTSIVSPNESLIMESDSTFEGDIHVNDQLDKSSNFSEIASKETSLETKEPRACTSTSLLVSAEPVEDTMYVKEKEREIAELRKQFEKKPSSKNEEMCNKVAVAFMDIDLCNRLPKEEYVLPDSVTAENQFQPVPLEEIKQDSSIMPRMFQKSSTKIHLNEDECSVGHTPEKGKRYFKAPKCSYPAKKMKLYDLYEFTETTYESSVGNRSSNTLCYMPQVRDDFEESKEKPTSPLVAAVPADMKLETNDYHPSSAIASESDKQTDIVESCESFEGTIQFSSITDEKEISEVEKQDGFHNSAESSESLSSSVKIDFLTDYLLNQTDKGMTAYRLWRMITLILLKLICSKNRKYSGVFCKRITDDIVPGYSKIVRRPMDLGTIKDNVYNGVIYSTSQFSREVFRVFVNVKMASKPSDHIYKCAVKMQYSSLEQIQSYITLFHITLCDKMNIE